jgi:hypothetical protein
MNKYFKSDIEDSLYVLEQEREERYWLDVLSFYVKYYHVRTRGYYSNKNEFVETFYYNNERLYWKDLSTGVYTACSNSKMGYYRAMPTDFEHNLYNDVDFAMDYIKNNPGNLVFIRTNNYKELVRDAYNYRVKFFNEEGDRIKELHAFATKDYCVNAYKRWHHHSFELVDLSSYKYLYAVSYKQMNEAVGYGYKEVDVIPFDPLVHFDTLTVNWRRASFIRMDEEEEFVDLSNQWQVIATNESITSIKVESNSK